MRKLLLAGTAGLLIAAGATSVASAYTANPNVPNWSPYTIMGFAGDGNVAPNPGYGGNPGFPAGTQPVDEGRSAYIEPIHHRHWNHPAGANTGMGDDPTGYDNSRQDPAYPGQPGMVGGY
jgi:hypothetical protein